MDSAMSLLLALLVEQHEAWSTGRPYLNMGALPGVERNNRGVKKDKKRKNENEGKAA